MKFAHSALPKNILASPVLFLSLILAGLLIVMATSQLMTFDKFVPIIQQYQPPGGSLSGKILAALIVVGELIALPFLLRMNLSFLMRGVSMVLLNLTALAWFSLGIWAATTQPPLTGTGILGGLSRSFPDIVILPFGAGLLALALASSWLLRRDLAK